MLKHTIWCFRWNVQITITNCYTHLVTLPVTLKQALLLPDPVVVERYFIFRSREESTSAKRTRIRAKTGSEPVCNLGVAYWGLVLHSSSNPGYSSRLFSTCTPRTKKGSKGTVRNSILGRREVIICRNGLRQVLWGSFLFLGGLGPFFSLDCFFFSFLFFF